MTIEKEHWSNMKRTDACFETKANNVDASGISALPSVMSSPSPSPSPTPYRDQNDDAPKTPEHPSTRGLSTPRNDMPSQRVETAEQTVPEKPNVKTKEDETMLKDPDYVKAIQTLMQNICRAHNEWGKASHLLELAVHRSSQNKDTCGTPIEKHLQEQLDIGKKLSDELRKVEKKYVTNNVIDQTEQTQCRETIAGMVAAAKKGKEARLLVTCGIVPDLARLFFFVFELKTNKYKTIGNQGTLGNLILRLCPSPALNISVFPSLSRSPLSISLSLP